LAPITVLRMGLVLRGQGSLGMSFAVIGRG
jgi:hypothetical protein